MSVGNRIKHYRKKCGFTQEKVAEALGIRVTNYAKYESGERTPKDDRLIELAKLFGIGFDALYSGAEANFVGLLYRHIVGAVNGNIDSFSSLHNDMNSSDGLYDIIAQHFAHWNSMLRERYKDLYDKYLSDEPTLSSLIELNKCYKRANGWFNNQYKETKGIAATSTNHCEPLKFNDDKLDDETLYRLVFCIAADKYMDLLQGDGFSAEFFFAEVREYKNDEKMDDEEACQLFAVYVLVPFLGHIISALDEIADNSDVGIDDFANVFLFHSLTPAKEREEWNDVD